MPAAIPLYVQYGCGDCAPKEWVNFDASPRLRIDRLPVLGRLLRLATPPPLPENARWGDICRGLPIPDDRAAGVYCSHVLEHLPREELKIALSQTKRMLRAGGRFRMVVPDLQWRARRYVESAVSGDPMAADRFLYSCLLGTLNWARGIDALLRRRYSLNAHLWMYDYASLKAQLEEAGFAAVRPCEPGDADDPMFALVEDRGRFFDGGERELAIEAIKPT